MKRIVKNSEPEAFREWKDSQLPSPSWVSLYGSPAKGTLHESLLDEQGCICCYCGKRIRLEDSHIEHLKPRSVCPRLQVEYDNLLASCEGDTNAVTPRRDRHCGHRKGEWCDPLLMVSPLQENCEEHFRYTLQGEIGPSGDKSMERPAQETILRLGLDSTVLKRARRRAITAVLKMFDPITAEKAERLVEGFRARDNDGQYAPFCAVIVYVLRRHFLP
jgi:uncharacterized protein (TIGR02646 family)